MPVCICITHANSYATLLSNTSLHNVYFRLPFLLFDICIQHVTLFVFASRSLFISLESIDQSRKALQIQQKTKIFKMYAQFMAMYASLADNNHSRDVNFDHFNTHIQTIPLPLLLLLLQRFSSTLDYACGSSFKFCRAIHFNRNHFCCFYEGYFFSSFSNKKTATTLQSSAWICEFVAVQKLKNLRNNC